jgi:general secretion pathway protein K
MIGRGAVLEHALERGADQRGDSGESGVALLMAVWVLALLALIAASVTSDVKAGLAISRNKVEASQTRALADAGVWAALAALLDARRAGTLAVDGRYQVVPMIEGGGSVSVAVQDEAGKIDVNVAAEDTLRSLFEIVGVAKPFATSLAKEINFYRSKREAVGAGSTPKPPVFLTQEELRLVPGMTVDLYARISPFITVYGGDGRVSAMTAPLAVLRATGLDAPTAERAVKDRGTPDAATIRPRVVTIMSRATLPSGAVFSREAVVDLTQRKERLYQLLAWTAPR